MGRPAKLNAYFSRPKVAARDLQRLAQERLIRQQLQAETPHTWREVRETAIEVWQRSHPFDPTVVLSLIPQGIDEDAKTLTEAWYREAISRILKDSRDRRFKLFGIVEKEMPLLI